MLTELQIRNFLIIESLDLSLNQGMTVVTGETGAGKSMLLDALQFGLGGRADSKLLRTGASEAQVTVQINDYVLKRVMNSEGRSRAYINGDLVSIQELKTLGVSLLSWVGQYEHQALLKQDAQMAALDAFANTGTVLAKVSESAAKISTLQKEHQALVAKRDQEAAALQFQHYQQEILDALSIEAQEWTELHEEQKKLSGAGALLQKLSGLLVLLHEDEPNLQGQVQRLNREVGQLAVDFTSLHNAANLLEEADVRLLEAYHELKAFYESLDLNEERLAEVEARLSEIHATARKLQVAPEALFELHQSLLATAEDTLDSALQACEAALSDAKAVYFADAKKLQQMRQEAALKLSEHVSREIKTLGMKEAEFRVDFSTPTGVGVERFPATGLDQVEFAVRINLGQKWGSLKNTASGGELSRIALVIAVLNAKLMEANTLIFDEVDVGVSGAVAEKVGKLLKALAESVQVICITHLPQVAMAGASHIHVSKEFRDGSTFGSAKILSHQERIEEMARIMSGETISDHARELAKLSLGDS